MPGVTHDAHAGGVEALVGHSEVVMCDFAACLLAELERWMLSATPAMIDLNSFADTSDYFTAPSSALEEVSKRLYTDEVTAGCTLHHGSLTEKRNLFRILGHRLLKRSRVLVILMQVGIIDTPLRTL